MRFYAIRCNVLNGYYATICKEACCRSHFKPPSNVCQMGVYLFFTTNPFVHYQKSSIIICSSRKKI